MFALTTRQPRSRGGFRLPLPRLRLAARLRLRNYVVVRRERALAFNRWLADYLRQQR